MPLTFGNAPLSPYTAGFYISSTGANGDPAVMLTGPLLLDLGDGSTHTPPTGVQSPGGLPPGVSATRKENFYVKSSGRIIRSGVLTSDGATPAWVDNKGGGGNFTPPGGYAKPNSVLGYTDVNHVVMQYTNTGNAALADVVSFDLTSGVGTLITAGVSGCGVSGDGVIWTHDTNFNFTVWGGSLPFLAQVTPYLQAHAGTPKATLVVTAGAAFAGQGGSFGGTCPPYDQTSYVGSPQIYDSGGGENFDFTPQGVPSGTTYYAYPFDYSGGIGFGMTIIGGTNAAAIQIGAAAPPKPGATPARWVRVDKLTNFAHEVTGNY